MSLDINKKIVLVMGLNDYIADRTDEQLLIDGVENINDLAVKVIKVFETLKDNSTLVVDIKFQFSSVLSEIVQFAVYDIDNMYRYDVNFNLGYVSE